MKPAAESRPSFSGAPMLTQPHSAADRISAAHEIVLPTIRAPPGASPIMRRRQNVEANHASSEIATTQLHPIEAASHRRTEPGRHRIHAHAVDAGNLLRDPDSTPDCRTATRFSSLQSSSRPASKLSSSPAHAIEMLIPLRSIEKLKP